MEVDLLSGCHEELIPDLVQLQRLAFPPRMQDPQPAPFFREALAHPDNLNLLLRCAKGGTAGYLLALPAKRVYHELKEHDPALSPDMEGYYIEIVQTDPRRRQVTSFTRLLQRLCRECRRRGIDRLSMHARTVNGASKTAGRLFAEHRVLRRIDNWYGSGEPFDYMEAAPRLRRESSRGDVP